MNRPETQTPQSSPTTFHKKNLKSFSEEYFTLKSLLHVRFDVATKRHSNM